MAARRRFDDMDCSVARALDAVGEWWSLLVVREAFGGVRRFDEFARRLGIAPNILTARLRALVAHGVLEQHAYSSHPPRYEYRLTRKGRDLFPVIVALLQWGDRWCTDDGPPVVLEHARCGHAANPRLVCGHCGQTLDPRETRARPGPGARRARASLGG